MEDKKLNFHIYRYHLLPIKSNSPKLDLFEEDKLTIKELKEKKNGFFSNILSELERSKSNKHPLKIEDFENDFYYFKLAQKKTTIISQNFENITVDNEPFVYVIINNNPKVQKIAISDNKEAFGNPNVVKNILKKTFNRDLSPYSLNIEIEQLFSQGKFWDYVNKHNEKITYINFQYIKPNMANISGSLPEVFKKFSDNTNSHESNIAIKAPEKGTLENINKTNKEINGLVDYTSKGAGSIKMKVKGIRKQLNTKESPTIIEVKQIDLEGSAEQVIKLYKSIVEE